ncbi:FAD/NAD(P)-binding domain-containing protein [Mycena polygramma]|nr:FAD/NAD(P)-binding domain-containing protein [Mycena polygramma]
MTTKQAIPLKIAVVGAGLAGLASAAALRKLGHEVHVFESSSMNKEIGAALSLSANSLRLLTFLGFDIKNLRACNYFGVHPGLLCHRSDLHNELKRLATMDEGEGDPVNIHLESDVVSCESATGKLTLKSGETYHADLIIGADGIHSTIRSSVLGYEQRALPSGRAAFRCLLEASKLEGFSQFDWLFSGMPGARGVRPKDGSGRYLFIYPCRDNTIINIVAHLPDLRDQDKFGKFVPPQIEVLNWNAPATKEELLATFADYAPEYTDLLELVEGPVHLWQIRALPCLPTWVKGCVALVGDAAHATFPTMGQGAGMALEDAVTIACLLPLGTTKEDIPRRLEAYQALRKPRGEFVLTESVEQVTVPSKRGLYSRSKEMQARIIGHDAVKVAQEYLATVFRA